MEGKERQNVCFKKEKKLSLQIHGNISIYSSVSKFLVQGWTIFQGTTAAVTNRAQRHTHTKMDGYASKTPSCKMNPH